MIMPEDEEVLTSEELSKKAFKCLVDNLGYFNASEYVASLIQEGRHTPPDYTEWQREYFGKMTPEEFEADLNEYIKNHPHEEREF